MSLSQTLAAPAPSSQRMLAASVIGNVVEWFDFAVYGYFAAIIGKLFFPAQEASLSLIAALSVFAVGFLVRPLGGLLFGYIGDTHGRSAALFLSIGVMAGATLAMGLLPTYETAGILAPVLMLLCRIVQGLAVGGEYACSIVVLVETAPANRRGFRGSLACLGATAGGMLGSAAGALLFHLLNAEEIAAWGWRLPFIAGVAVALAGVYLRRNLALSHAAPPVAGLRFFEAVAAEWKAMLKVVGLNLVASVGYYMTFIYLVQYMQDISGAPPAAAFEVNTVNMIVVIVLMPVAGYLSDRFGRKPVIFASLGALLLAAWPLFELLHAPSVVDLFLAQFGLTLLLGFYLGIVPVLLVEQFSAAVRCTAAASSYNLVIGVFGGTTPIACVYLIAATGNDMVPALYLMAAAALALLTAVTIRETAFTPLKR